MATQEIRRCLNCDTMTASIPRKDPVFCNDECAGAFVRDRWAWCDKHRCWWDVEMGCEKCEKRRQVGELRKQQADLGRRIEELEADS